MPVQIQLRHDTAANWTAADPTLALGEVGIETNTGKLKIGTGAALWSALPYSSGANTIITKDEGSTLYSAVTTLDFVGAGVTASGAGATTTVTIPGGSGGVTVKDEGGALATVADTLDFVGAGVVASGVGTTKTITISGAAVADILDLPTAEMDDALVLAPDGAGGVEFRAEVGGSGDPRPYFDSGTTLHATYGDDFTAAALDGDWTAGGFFKPYAAGYAMSGTWLRFPAMNTNAQKGHIYRAGPGTDSFEVIASFATNETDADMFIGPAIVSSTGTGVIAALEPSGSNFSMHTASSYIYGGAGVSMAIGGGAAVMDYSRGEKQWISIRKVATALVGDIYWARFSLNGYAWSKSVILIPAAFTAAKIGFGVFNDQATTLTRVHLDRLNVVDDLDYGDNLVITPTSGTATYTASSSFGGFPASNAADGTSASWAADTGATDNPLYWQVAWSVGQTLNRVVFRERNAGGLSFGTMHVELSDGATTTYVPVEDAGIGVGVLWHLVDFPTLTGITSLRIVSDVGGGDTAGFDEVEAYYRS